MRDSVISRPLEAGGRRIARWLLGVFVLAWIALAFEPRNREDWLLENLPVLIAVPLLIRGYRREPWSIGAYISLFIFFMLHIVGAHYTYSEVPYDAWAKQLFGVSITDSLGWSRNHFDRLAHFAYGLLIAVPSVELLDRRAPAQKAWRWVLPVFFIMAHGVIYELVEWMAALVVGAGLGAAYLGTQGDVWDAQWDMALAAAGATLTVIWLRARRLRQLVS